MKPYIFTYKIFNHSFTVYATIDKDLEDDCLRDESIGIEAKDITIAAVFCGVIPAFWDGEPGIRACLTDRTLQAMRDEGIYEIEDALRIERAGNGG